MIKVDEATNTVFVYVSFSKTLHFGNRYLIIPILSNSDDAMDPVRHLSALFSAVDCQPDSPAFSYWEIHYIQHVHYQAEEPAGAG